MNNNLILGQKKLSNCCITGDLEKFKICLADIRLQSVAQKDILEILNVNLIVAAKYDKLNIVKHLLENCNANINTTDELNNNIVMIGIENQNETMIQYLFSRFKSEIDLDHKNDDFANLIMLASRQSSEKLFYFIMNAVRMEDKEYLIKDIDRNNNNVFDYAVQGGNLDIIKYLVKNQNKYNLEYCPDSVEYVVRNAAYNDEIELVKYFIEKHGANKNDSGPESNNLIVIACLSNNVKLLEYLILESKCNINKQARDYIESQARNDKVKNNGVFHKAIEMIFLRELNSDCPQSIALPETRIKNKI